MGKLLFALVTAALVLPGAPGTHNTTELFQAIRNGDNVYLRNNLDKATLEARDSRGATPLMHAAAFGSLETMKLLLDAHADTWDSFYGERYFHGTPFRRALEEGLIDPQRSLLAGMRGSLYASGDLQEPRDWGFEILSTAELRALSPAEYEARVRRRLGDGPAYFSFDIDVLDPAFAPGTGTPEVAGVLPHEALAFLRALAGVGFVGFDLVEVCPPYDNPGQITALSAANVVHEFLALIAVTI